MMRRPDIRHDPKFATPQLRKQNLKELLAEVSAWLLTFTDLQQMQAQVGEAGLAIGVTRTTREFADSEWVDEWGAIVNVDDRAGGTVRMPGAPWKFSKSVLPEPGQPSFQGEHNDEVFKERKVSKKKLDNLRARNIILSRRHPVGEFDL